MARGYHFPTDMLLETISESSGLACIPTAVFFAL